MNFVLGARGRLGHAIASSLSTSQVKTPNRSVYTEWWHDGAADDVSRYFERCANSEGVVYVAAGIIDPKKPVDHHDQVNFLLAKNVVLGASKLGLKVVTFGTVMEKIVGEKSVNPYFSSKVKLGNFVEDFCTKSSLALHIRIHTLFGGGRPDEFMFLGQIFNAIRSHVQFKMSPGMQLREYHYIDDEVVAIYKLVDSGVSGAIELSHGAPVTLRDLAKYIFAAYKCPELLKIGALPEPVNDNHGLLFERPPALCDVVFRDTFPAVVEYLCSCEV